MKLGIVKTIDKVIYKYENPVYFRVENDFTLLRVVHGGAEIFFPLVNVIAFSIEEVKNDN